MILMTYTKAFNAKRKFEGVNEILVKRRSITQLITVLKNYSSILQDMFFFFSSKAKRYFLTHQKESL